MTLEWTIHMTSDFPDHVINYLCDLVRKEGYNEDTLIREINEEVLCFEDDEYYAWGVAQTKAVLDEIKRRVGGIQLSMFNDPFGVPEDYNEGWR